MELLQAICIFWKTIVTLLTPLLLLPFLLAYPRPEVECAYVIGLMAVYWITECIPMGLTAFLPVIIYPMMGLMSVPNVADNYMTNTHLLIFGSVMIAIAVENSGLHKRAALKTLLIVGTSPRRLLFGVMFSTWFLSMWLSNIGTTAMILPVVTSIVSELRVIAKQRIQAAERNGGEAVFVENVNEMAENPNLVESNTKLSLQGLLDDGEGDVELKSYRPSIATIPEQHSRHASGSKSRHVSGRSRHESSRSVRSAYCVDPDAESLGSSDGKDYSDKLTESMSKMLMIAICYAGNIGGTASLIGTPSNVLAHDLLQVEYEKHDLKSPVTFVTWMPMAIPGAFIMLILTWLWLQIYFLRGACMVKMSEEETKGTHAIIQQQYNELGRVKYSEKNCLVFFVILFFMWFFRGPGFMPGYNDLFKNGYLTDATPVLVIAFLMFICPSEKPKLFCFKRPHERMESVPALLDWKSTMAKQPWTAFFMIGGGFAMAEASRISGLSLWLGTQLAVLESLPTYVITFIVCIITSALTQIAFNLATISLIFPILMSLSETIGTHPLHFTIPATMLCSSAFMLPASTAPNAMVFEAAGNIRVVDMIGCGFFINMMFVMVAWLGTETWIAAMFHFNTLPWGAPGDLNMTSTLSPIPA